MFVRRGIEMRPFLWMYNTMFVNYSVLEDWFESMIKHYFLKLGMGYCQIPVDQKAANAESFRF